MVARLVAVMHVGAAPLCDLTEQAYTVGHWVPRTLVPEEAREAREAASVGNRAWGDMNASCAPVIAAWAWAPETCAVARFDADAFLGAVANQHVLFVGDSITEMSFEALRGLLGNRTTIPEVFYSADMYGLHQNPRAKGPAAVTKCRDRVVDSLPERWTIDVDTWLCCKVACQTRACCRTLRQFYAPAANATFSLHVTATPVDLSTETPTWDPVDATTDGDCLLRLRERTASGRVLDEYARKCRVAPWSHHLGAVDLLVLNVGHHYHNYDDRFLRYADMVNSTLALLEDRFPTGSKFVFRGSNHGFPPVKEGCKPFLCTAPQEVDIARVDAYHWWDAVHHELVWPEAIQKRRALRGRSLYLDIRRSSALRPDAMLTDCLHPLFPVYDHWFALLSQWLRASV